MYMRKSTDNGLSWTDLENITNSNGYNNSALEVGMHLANIGSDDEIGVFCQVPNFNVETYPPAASYEDYMNYVYVGKYENTEMSVPDHPQDENVTLTISLVTDSWPEEIYWELYDAEILTGSNFIGGISAGDLDSEGVEYTWDVEIPRGSHYFVIYDTYGDGNSGGFTLSIDGTPCYYFDGTESYYDFTVEFDTENLQILRLVRLCIYVARVMVMQLA